MSTPSIVLPPAGRRRRTLPGAADLLDLVWPASCAGCGATGVAASPACRDCLAPLLGPAHPTRPHPCPPGLPPLWAVAGYVDQVRSLLVAYKEDGRHRLAAPLGAALGTAVEAALRAATVAGSGAAPDHRGRHPPRSPVRRPPGREPAGRERPPGRLVVVPVPSSAAARRRRGEDVLLRLARVAVRRLPAAYPSVALLPALRQRRSVADQAGLGAFARASNLQEALVVIPAARPVLEHAAGVVLVDDIVTTGATLLEASRALAAAGVAVTGGAVVAATPRRSLRLPPTGRGPASATTVDTWRPPGSVVASG